MTKRKSSGGGSTLYGVMAGLLIGLMVAAAVAYYVIKAPMPFVDKASRSPEAQGVIDPRTAPDPNAGLYGRDGAAGTAPMGPTDAPLVPLPGTAGAPAKPAAGAATPDDLGALIATLPVPSSPGTASRAPRATSPAIPAPGTGPSATGASSGAGAVASVAPGTSSTAAGATYYLQVGSFRVLEDAESLRARILLMGMPVEIQRAEVNGMQFNRVRVGPYARLDDMNRSRARLGEEKIPATVIRQ